MVLAKNIGDQDGVPDSLIQSGQSVTVVGVWGMNHRVRNCYLRFSFHLLVNEYGFTTDKDEDAGRP